MKNFKELGIWKKGMDIATLSFKLVLSFPKEEKFGLSSQITRASVSIPSNIAEGSSRHGDREYDRFISFALGSCFELETQLLIAEAVNYGDFDLRQSLLVIVGEERRMLLAFSKSLRFKNPRP